MLFVIIAHTLFIFFSYDICTASTVNQPGHCDEDNGPQPKTSLQQHYFP